MRFENLMGNGVQKGQNSVRFCLTVWGMACMLLYETPPPPPTPFFFQAKNIDIFLISAWKSCCEYSSEVPHRDTSMVNVLKFLTLYFILFWPKFCADPDLIWVCSVCICHFVRNFGVQNLRTFYLMPTTCHSEIRKLFIWIYLLSRTEKLHILYLP